MPAEGHWASRALASVAAKYARPEELEHAGRKVAGGLDPDEAALVARLFHPGSRILDVGCGAGREAIALARHGCQVTAIDLVPAMIELARGQAARAGVHVTFQVKSVTDLDHPSGWFDEVLFSANVYGYIPCRTWRVDVLRRVHTALRQGGTLVFSAYNRRAVSRGLRNSLRDLVRRFPGWGLWHDHGPEPGDRWVRNVSGASGPDSPLCFCHHATIDEVTEEIEQAGLLLEDITTHEELVRAERRFPGERRRMPTLIYIARKPGMGRGP